MRSAVKRVPVPGDLLRVHADLATWVPTTLAGSGLPYFEDAPGGLRLGVLARGELLLFLDEVDGGWCRYLYGDRVVRVA